MSFNILFENSDLIAVDKPADYNFHTEDDSLGFAASFQQAYGSKLFPLHRLDKITSGLLLFAKNSNAAKQAGKLFEQRQINKTYIALSSKKPKKKQGRIIGDMIKARNGSWKLAHTKEKPAITLFQSQALQPGIRFFWIRPSTGKTHQIRVALKSIGSPILGDLRYSGESADRGYLHAYQLNFCWKGEEVSIKSQPKSGKLFINDNCKRLISEFENSNN